MQNAQLQPPGLRAISYSVHRVSADHLSCRAADHEGAGGKTGGQGGRAGARVEGRS